jgi:hypothetical protein
VGVRVRVRAGVLGFPSVAVPAVGCFLRGARWGKRIASQAGTHTISQHEHRIALKWLAAASMLTTGVFLCTAVIAQVPLGSGERGEGQGTSKVE